MRFRVREVSPSDAAAWLDMRSALWPSPRADMKAEVDQYFTSRTPGTVTLVAEADDGGLLGFLEMGRRDVAEECETSPVAYIEGWYVEPAVRRTGVGRALVEAAEAWASCVGYREMASDAYVDNGASIAAHTTLGYARTPPIVCFHKRLGAHAELQGRSARACP